VFAGSGAAASNDGPALVASFWKPSAIAIDGASNKFVADTLNYRVRLINPEGMVSTLAGAAKGFADGVGTAAAFFNPRGLTIAPPPAATITLVRHGQSTWNEAGRMQGSSDESVLTPRGRAQAAAARDAVRRGGGRGEADAS
jgi:hypothetical protein